METPILQAQLSPQQGGAVTLSFLLAPGGLSGGICSDGDGVEGAGNEWVSVFKANVAHSQITVLPSGPRSCARPRTGAFPSGNTTRGWLKCTSSLRVSSLPVMRLDVCLLPCLAPLTTVQQLGKVGWASQFSSCGFLLLLPCCPGFRLVAWPPTLLGFSFQPCSCSQEIFLGNTSMRSPGLISLSFHAQLRPAGPQPGP